MIKSVYAHHTSRIAELMLQQAVKSYIETEDIDSSEVVEIDDFQLHTRLLDSSGISHELYSSVINRHLYKRSKIVSPVDAVDQFNAYIEDSIDSGELTKEHLADKFGVPDHWIIVDMPQSHKIKPIDVDIIWNNSVVSIELLSEVPRTVYDSTVNTNDIFVYSHPSVRNEVTNYLQEQFA
jgi:HD superfamily phosphohydrolase